MKPFWFFGIPLRGVLVLMFLVGCIIAWPAFLTTVPASAIYSWSTFAVMGIILFLGSFPEDGKMELERKTLLAAEWFLIFISIGVWFGTIVFTDSSGEAWYQMFFNVLCAWGGFLTGFMAKFMLLGAQVGFKWAFCTSQEKKEG